MDIIKELNDFENLLKINDNILERDKDKKEKNEITKINEIKNRNIKIYQRNNKNLKEIKEKSLSIDKMNTALSQNIKKIYVNCLKYILSYILFILFKEFFTHKNLLIQK
jgi:D-alanine-D-alanine ligase-like ATP-grasp enzyme